MSNNQTLECLEWALMPLEQSGRVFVFRVYSPSYG